MKRTILSLALIAALADASAQDISIKAAFDSSKIVLGDQIHYTLTIDQPAGTKLSLPYFHDTLTKNIEVISGPAVDSSVSGNRLRIIQKYIVTSFDSGRYHVPPVFAEVKSGEGIKRFYSDYATLQVNRVNTSPADTSAKIFDIVSPYKSPITAGEVLPWILAAVLLAALIWAGLRYGRKLRGRKKDIVEIADPAHIIAFRQLEKLKNEHYTERGEIKIYYSELTEILRRYLENRFNFNSLEMTTAETLHALVSTGFRMDASYERLKSVLTGADLVKFAKHKPDAGENEDSFRNSWEFVDATKEEVVISPEDELKEKQGRDV